MGLQLLRQCLPKALVFDALQQRGGQERLQAPFLPSRRERGLVRQARWGSLLSPALPGLVGTGIGPSGLLVACGICYQGGGKGKWSANGQGRIVGSDPGAREGQRPC